MPSRLEDTRPGLVVEVVEVRYVEHCPNFPAALTLVERIAADLGVYAEVRATRISDQTSVERARFVVRPTVRVDGRDVDPEGELSAEYSLECRLYWHEHRLAGYPQDRSVRDALLRAAGPI